MPSSIAVEPLAERLHDGVGTALGLVALVERIEHHEHRAQVRPVGPQHERHAADADHVADPGHLADDLRGPAHHLLGPLQRRRIGKLDGHEQVALVLVGNEARGHLAEAPTGQVQQPAVDHQHQDAHAQQLADRPRVSVERGGERLVEQLEEPAEAEVEDRRERVAVGVPLLEQQRSTARG